MNTSANRPSSGFRTVAYWTSVVIVCAVALTVGAYVGAQALEAPEVAEAPVAADSAVACPFCLTPFRNKDEFCARCGRLARLTSTSAEHRFWGDAVYVEFARWGDMPKLEAELAPTGLIREVATFNNSGDRIEMSIGKKGLVIEGKMGGSVARKEDSYKAEMTETLDAQQRLAQRSVWAKRSGDPDTYIYRVVDYKYSPDGLLDRIAFTTKSYLGASDWKKHPAGWSRHVGGEIVMKRAEGALRTIETTVRTFKRSLRGEPELGEEKTMKETVSRSGELVDAVVLEPTASR